MTQLIFPYRPTMSKVKHFSSTPLPISKDIIMCFLNQCKCNWLPQCRVKSMFAFQLQRSSQFSRRHTIGIYFKSNRVWLNSLVLAGGNYLVPNFNLRCWRRGDQRSRVPGGKTTRFHLKLTYYSPKCKLRKEPLLNIVSVQAPIIVESERGLVP